MSKNKTTRQKANIRKWNQKSEVAIVWPSTHLPITNRQSNKKYPHAVAILYVYTVHKSASLN